MAYSLTKEMRIATREIHNVSDALVNAKLAFALNNDKVWADGILVFYEIFKFLEENVSAQVLPVVYHRTQQFENDLSYFKGSDWKRCYTIRPEVQKYLDHLNEINERNPLLLIAYVYHLYMGLLSGGQILTKKRNLASRFLGGFGSKQKIEPGDIPAGCHLTAFPGNTISELKTKMRRNIDDFCKDFDENLRQELIEESKMVFQLNNEIIKTVEGVGQQLRKNFRNFIGVTTLVFLSFYLFVKMWHV